MTRIAYSTSAQKVTARVTTPLDKTAPVLSISMTKSTDTVLQGQYDYEIELELADVALLLRRLATNGLDTHFAEISDALGKSSTRDLYRLLAAATKTMPNPSNE